MHRTIRLLCLISAVAALLASAQTGRRLAQMALKEIGPLDHTVPPLTDLMVVRVADGSFPLVLVGAALAVALAMSGLFAIFSTRLSRDSAGTTLVAVCTVGFVAALLILATTAIGIAIGRAPVP